MQKVSSFLALALLVATAGPVSAQADSTAVFRTHLQSKIIFSGGEEGPDPTPNLGSPQISMPAFRAWATVGDAVPQLLVNGGLAPYTIQSVGDSIPGASIVDNQFQGIFGAPGIYGLRFSATDSQLPAKTGYSDALQVEVSQPLLATYPSGTITWRLESEAHLDAPSTSGGRGDRNFINDSLPAGLVISPSTGVISGTPTAAGNGTVSTVVSDADGRQVTAQREFTISAVPLSVTGTDTGMSGSIGQPFTKSLGTTGNIGSVTWSLDSGTLPDGVTLNPSTGAISGTPTVSGTFSGLRVRATDPVGSAASPPFNLSISSDIVATINTTTANVVLPGTYFTSAQWTDSAITKRLVIPAGVVVHSQSTVAALTVSSGPGKALVIENHGEIYGGGGLGGSGGGGNNAGTAGSQGGAAIKVVAGAVSIDNQGTIKSGGGGGGGGGSGGEDVVFGTFSGLSYSLTTNACGFITSPPQRYIRVSGVLLSNMSYTEADKFTPIYANGFAYRCDPTLTQRGTEGSWKTYQVERASYTQSSGSKGNGTAGGRGASYNSAAPATQASTTLGGRGGMGGDLGQSGAVGERGTNGNKTGGFAGGGSGLAGRIVDGTATWINTGTRAGEP